MTVDIRNPSTSTRDTIHGKLEGWCSRAGTGVSYKLLDPICPPLPCTQIDPLGKYNLNTQASLGQRMWAALCETLESAGFSYRPQVFPAATDGRHLREMGVPIIGFSGVRRTPIRAHANDEFLTVENFLEGIRIYQLVIPALANLS